MPSVAAKDNPRLWEDSKNKACSKGGLCLHSARKMQWATRYYKAHGGGYVGKKSSNNSLHLWGQQKWRTSSGKKSRGKLRYLPDEAWRHLSKREIRRTNESKRKGYARGKQWVRQPAHIARKTSWVRRHHSSRRSSGRRAKREARRPTHRTRSRRKRASKRGRRR